MNFYPPPPTIQAQLYLRVPNSLRCTGQPTEWRGGSASPPSDIFLEGPTVAPDGALYMVDIPYGRILRVDSGSGSDRGSDKQVSVSECVRYDGEPNGLALLHDGCFAVADYKQGILKFNPISKTITPLLPRRNLERFKGPNDLIVASNGDLYFTDQGQTGLTDSTGCVYRLSLDGKLDCLVSNGISPNGLALSPDERFLYVAMTRANAVWRLPLHEDGTTTKVGLFFQSFGNAGPDGLAVDEEGNVFICHPSLGSVFVVDAEGVPKARIVTAAGGGKNLTNCCFGGEDGRTLFITDSMMGNVQFVRWNCAGIEWVKRRKRVAKETKL